MAEACCYCHVLFVKKRYRYKGANEVESLQRRNTPIPEPIRHQKTSGNMVVVDSHTHAQAPDEASAFSKMGATVLWVPFAPIGWVRNPDSGRSLQTATSGSSSMTTRTSRSSLLAMFVTTADGAWRTIRRGIRKPRNWWRTPAESCGSHMSGYGR